MIKKQLLYSFIPISICTTLISSHNTMASEVPTLSLTVTKVDSEHFNGERIEAALNEYIYPLIGANIDLEFVEMERYNQVFSKYIASGQIPDIFTIGENLSLDSLINQDLLLPLDELLSKYGQGILNTIDSESLIPYTIQEEIYGIPSLHDRACCYGFEYRVRIAEEYNLDMENVQTLDDLTEIFSQLKTQNPDIIPCCETTYQTWDSLNDNLGVLMDGGKNSKITNLYESDVFEKFCRRVNLWNQKDYLLTDDIGYLSINQYVNSPEIFGKFSGCHPGLIYVDSADAGEEIACIPLTEPFLSTEVMTRNAFFLSSNCKYPEIAMKFLNLLYTDPHVVNLLCYGIEGIHYQVIDKKNGIIDFAEGVSKETSDYAQFRTYNWGNQYLAYIWNGYPTNLWQQIQDFNKNTPRSAAYGFRYDPSPVQTEVNACNQIKETYLPLLNAGVGNVDQILTEFQNELQKSGIHKIISEKQRQLDEFLKNKESS